MTIRVIEAQLQFLAVEDSDGNLRRVQLTPLVVHASDLGRIPEILAEQLANLEQTMPLAKLAKPTEAELAEKKRRDEISAYAVAHPAEPPQPPQPPQEG